MRPFCRHALPNRLAASGSVHGAGSTGAFQRKAPTGALAKGTPFHEYVPVVAPSLLPCTWPKLVGRRAGSESEPPQLWSTRARLAPSTGMSLLVNVISLSPFGVVSTC